MNQPNPDLVSLVRSIAFLIMGVFFIIAGLGYVGLPKIVFLSFGVLDIAYSLRVGIISLKRLRSAKTPKA